MRTEKIKVLKKQDIIKILKEHKKEGWEICDFRKYSQTEYFAFVYYDGKYVDESRTYNFEVI